MKILGCGSAYYVGQMGASLVEELARIPAGAEAASEFRYRNPIIEPDTLYAAVTQSGETVDTRLGLQEIRRKGRRVVGLVNVVGSAIARECDGARGAPPRARRRQAAQPRQVGHRRVTGRVGSAR